MRITLIRHGQSKAQTGEQDPQDGDFKVELTDRGIEQATELGKVLKERDLIFNSLLYSSPYRRARQTMDLMLKSASIQHHLVYEDPRLRECDHGYENTAAQQERRKQQGWFWYRFEGGESAADVFDRCSTFLESLKRQIERKKTLSGVVIVSHGIAIRALIMRWLHLTVEEYESLANPANCSPITIEWIKPDKEYQFKSGSWGVRDLKLR